MDTVHHCVIHLLEDRPPPQELLTTIERLMVNHTEGMIRWGTSSWIKSEHDKIRDADAGALDS